MSPGDLVRIKNTIGTRMLYTEIVGKVGVIISRGEVEDPRAEAAIVGEVLVEEKVVLLAWGYLEPAR